MPLVAAVDYTAKRIYLSAESVGVSLDTLDVYREVRALRRTAEAHRAHRPMIIGGGGVRKTAATFTQQYVQLLYGCRIVPYDAPQVLTLVRETFTDDDLVGAACFDRSGLTSIVNIDVQVSPVEVREVATGGGSLTAAQVWAYVNRTLTGTVPANVKQVNDVAIAGTGQPGSDPWRPAA